MDALVKRYFGQIPVQNLLTVVYCVLLLLSLASAAWLLISSGNRIVSRVVTDGANATARQATLEISRFLRTPAVIGQSVHNALRAGYIDLDDPDSLSRFFFELPQRTADYGVSGIYIADSDGKLAAVDSDLRDGEARWFVLHSSAATNGRLNKHVINADGTAGARLDEGDPFDATRRPRFVQAAAGSSAVWTSVYQDAHTGQPVLTWAQAIRDANGQLEAVVGVDLLVARVRQFLQQLPISENTAVLIADSSGALIGNELMASDTQANRLVPQQILKYLDDVRGGITSIESVYEERVSIDGSRGLLKVLPLTENADLEWRVGVFVPLSDYLSSLTQQMARIVPLDILTLLIVWLALQLFVRLMVRPLLQLKDSANRIADGRFNVFIDTSCSNEVGELASAIESMRQRLKRAFADITKQKVRAETTLASIANGVITVSSDGGVEYMNKRRCNTADCQPTRWLASRWRR